MTNDNPIYEILKRDRRYKIESYRFVNTVLNQAARRLERGTASILQETPPEAESLIGPADLCRAVRDSALENFGFLARTVLSEMGIKKTQDIGQIIFNLSETGQVRLYDDDRPENFADLFDLGEELDRGFRFRR